MKNIALLFTLACWLCLPLSGMAQSACQTPITAAVDSITCNDNGTPLDSLDDTFGFYLSVTGDSTAWALLSDTTLYPYDSAFAFGPFLISGGALTLVVLNTSDSLCTDTVQVTPPPPCSFAPLCPNPISGSVDSILCSDNGTPLDSLDDTYTFMLIATGGTGAWQIQGDSLTHPYDTAIVAGPYPINGGLLTLVLEDSGDSLCIDTITVTPPPPCSVPPTCQTPVSAAFAGVACSDNGTPLDSLDDTFTFLMTVSGGANSWSLSGDTLSYPYDTAVTVGPYTIAAGPLTLVAVDNDDALCTDTVMVTPPPSCSVPPTACDVKEIGCMRYELLGITMDSSMRKTYTVQVINNCTDKMIYTAIQLPNGLTAKAPDDNSVYTAPSGREYLVRNPNFSPFYSIRFKSGADSISNGQSDIFEYTLPAQADPTFIHVVSRIAPKVFYEAHLNTFACDVVLVPLVTPSNQFPGPKTGQVPSNPTTPGSNPGNPGTPAPNDPGLDFTVYPNPNTGDGPVMVDLTDWKGLDVQLQLFNPQGKLLSAATLTALDQPQPFDLPKGLDAGLYWLKLVPPSGQPLVRQLVIQW